MPEGGASSTPLHVCMDVEGNLKWHHHMGWQMGLETWLVDVSRCPGLCGKRVSRFCRRELCDQLIMSAGAKRGAVPGVCSLTRMCRVSLLFFKDFSPPSLLEDLPRGVTAPAGHPTSARASQPPATPSVFMWIGCVWRLAKAWLPALHGHMGCSRGHRVSQAGSVGPCPRDSPFDSLPGPVLN